ncbi:MAG: zinc ABC transporter substrate-binding protein [Actinomycetota bacterium]|nr:zinc ABC transporter substrate-binding protein [Actinomycetota bacterium]
MRALLLVPALGVALGACGSSSTTAAAGTGTPVVASINAWGSILAQLGGTHATAKSIITNPNTDPHSYEPSPADGRSVAAARLVILNGLGYDSWADKLLEANPDASRVVINVGKLVGVGPGGNPHRWYSPADVEKVADTITADLKTLDPANAAYLDEQRQVFENQGLGRYHSLIADIKAAYAGTAVGASESIFAPQAEALGLNLVTPPSFLNAISEGTDPSPADKATIDNQIATKAIGIYVYNSQNSTPDVAAQVKAAKAKGIPVAAVTETLSPPKATFEEWQAAQLQTIEDALRQGAGR